MEKQIHDKIVEIVQQVNNMIPVEWKDLYINFEVSSNLSGEIYFFYKYRGEYHYFFYIPKDYGISNKVFMEEYRILFKRAQELKSIFLSNNLAEWSSGLIYVNEQSKLAVDFDYTPWLESDFGPSARTNYFRYKYLGFRPRDTKEQKLFDAMEAFQKEYNPK